MPFPFIPLALAAVLAAGSKSTSPNQRALMSGAPPVPPEPSRDPFASFAPNASAIANAQREIVQRGSQMWTRAMDALDRAPMDWHQLFALVQAGRLPIRIKRDGGHYETEIALPLRDGRVLVCKGSCDLRAASQDLGRDFDSDMSTISGLLDCEPDELGAMYEVLPECAAAEVGAREPNPKQYEQVAAWFWKNGSAAKLNKSVSDVKARAAWWASLGADKHQDTLATFRAFKDEHHPDGGSMADHPVDAIKWWNGLGKDRRVQIRHRYRRGFHDLMRIAKQLPPRAAKLIPIVGPVMSEGAKEAIEQAASGKAALQVASRAAAAARPAIMLGQQLHRAAVDKSQRDAILTAANVVRQPEVLKALGAVTGGKVVEQLAAASAAARLLETARAAPQSAAGKQAIATVQASLKLAKQNDGKYPILDRLQKAGHAMQVIKASSAPAAKKQIALAKTKAIAKTAIADLNRHTVKAVPEAKAIAAHVKSTAKLATAVRKSKARSKLATPAVRHTAAVLPKPAPAEVARYLVSIARTSQSAA